MSGSSPNEQSDSCAQAVRPGVSLPSAFLTMGAAAIIVTCLVHKNHQIEI